MGATDFLCVLQINSFLNRNKWDQIAADAMFFDKSMFSSITDTITLGYLWLRIGNRMGPSKIPRVFSEVAEIATSENTCDINP